MALTGFVRPISPLSVALRCAVSTLAPDRKLAFYNGDVWLGLSICGYMMISPPIINFEQSEGKEVLSHGTLNVLNTYLDELIREEQLCHRAQVLLRRIATPICMLAENVPDIFSNQDHPARGIFENVVRIAKLSGAEFAPSDVLYKTMMESIKTLQANKLSNQDTLITVNADLQYVLKLATIRAPKERRAAIKNAGVIANAKTIAALIVFQQSHCFPLSDALLHFALGDWFELMVVTILQKGHHKAVLKKIERMTFMLFYLSAVKPKYQRKKVGLYFYGMLRAATHNVESECFGFPVEFDKVKAQARLFARAPYS